MSPITSGRFTSIPSVARSFNWSSSVISFSLSFRFICLYNIPLVLKNFLSGSPLIVYHSFNSSYVGFSSLIARFSNYTLCASSHFNAFMQVLHFLYTNTFIVDSPFPFLLIFHNILLVFHIFLPTFYFFYTMPYCFCNHILPCS